MIRKVESDRDIPSDGDGNADRFSSSTHRRSDRDIPSDGDGNLLDQDLRGCFFCPIGTSPVMGTETATASRRIASLSERDIPSNGDGNPSVVRIQVEYMSERDIPRYGDGNFLESIQ